MKKTPVVVVGAGYWGKNHVRNFFEIGNLAGICDPNLSQESDIVKQFNVPLLTWEEILKNPALPAVVIAAPAHVHYRLVKDALLANKHVFVEKPLTLYTNETQELCELADKQKRVLMVGHLLQYHPAYIKLREIVKSGQLGRIQYIYSNRLNLGKILREVDSLWSFAPHDISMILGLIGHEPEAVSATGGYYLHQSLADVTTTHLSFPGGEKAHIFVSWLHPFKEHKLVVIGDKAMAVFDDGLPWVKKLVLYPHSIEWREGMPLPNKADEVPILINQDEPLRQECLHFVECVETGKKPVTDGWEGLRVLKVLEQASHCLDKTAAQTPKNSVSLRHVFVHETAVVDPGVELGHGTKIWHFSHILGQTKIGKDTIIGQNVCIGPQVNIGDRCKIQNNVSIYKGVTLEDGVFCGPSCVFTNVMNPRAEIERKDAFLPTLVERGVTIGANATIVCGTKLGAYCFIGAGAVITKDVPPHALIVGNPGRQIGWVSHAGERLGSDLVCPREGRQYRINENNQLEEIQKNEQFSRQEIA